MEDHAGDGSFVTCEGRVESLAAWYIPQDDAVVRAA
jgi:hypothetical protein